MSEMHKLLRLAGRVTVVLVLYFVTSQVLVASAANATRFELAYADLKEFNYFLVDVSKDTSRGSLFHVQLANRPAGPPKSVAFDLNQKQIQEFMKMVESDSMSFDETDYWLNTCGVQCARIEEYLDCSFIRRDERKLASCGVGRGSGPNLSPAANHVAAIVEYFHSLIESERAVGRAAKVERMQEILSGFWARVRALEPVNVTFKDSGAELEIPMRYALASAVAEAMVSGGFIKDPMADNDALIRGAAVVLSEAKMPGLDAVAIVRRGLTDVDPVVRRNAAFIAVQYRNQISPDPIDEIHDVIDREEHDITKRMLRGFLGERPSLLDLLPDPNDIP